MGPKRWNKFWGGGTNLSLQGASTVAATSPLCFLFQVGRHASYQPYKSVLVWKWFSQKTIYLVGLCGNRVTWFNLIWKTENKFPHLSSSSSPHKIWPRIYNFVETKCHCLNEWIKEWMNKINLRLTFTPQSSFTFLKTALKILQLRFRGQFEIGNCRRRQVKSS